MVTCAELWASATLKAVAGVVEVVVVVVAVVVVVVVVVVVFVGVVRAKPPQLASWG